MSRRWKNLAAVILWPPLRALLFLLGVLPEPAAYGLAGVLGRLACAVLPSRRRLAAANVASALPDLDRAQRRRVVRGAFVSAVRVLVDLARTPRLVARGQFDERVDLNELRAAAAEASRVGGGSAALFCTPHLGSWEVAGTAFARVVGRCHVIARPLEPPALDAWFRRRRSVLGQEIHPRRGGVRKVRAALVRGEAAGFLPDQRQRLRPVVVPFFGRPAATDRSPIVLGLLGGHPIVVGAVLRVGSRYRFRCRVADVFLPEVRAGEEREAAVRRCLVRLNRALERLIAEAPDQYFWLHDRWRGVQSRT